MNASQINVASDRFCSLEQDAVDMTLVDHEDACRDASCEKHKFSREQRKLIQVMNVKRKRLSLLGETEQQKIVDKVYLSKALQKTSLVFLFTVERAFTPKGKGRSAIQFGCCFNYRTSKAGTPAGILRHETVEPLPALFQSDH
ncbi:hypothetical protein HID58_024521 [Brassica napus]|uniref:Uncharacterized protein n=1 Tax=Brassica napus TaxID=3708 RepID=A0ABQ7XGH3_BRANA|nr:hypothetical protein HID58_024521 [Brassica napus]